MRKAKALSMVAAVLLLCATSSALAQGKRRAVRHPGPANPAVINDSYSVARGGTLTVGAATGILSNDTELQSKPLTAILLTTTTHGTLTLNADGGFTYANSASSTATSDSFSYKASNGTSDSSAASVTISITDSAPTAIDDAFAAGAGSTLTVPAPGVLANDTKNNAAISSYGATGAEQAAVGAATTTAQSGTVNLNADGGFIYQPVIGFTGSDVFKYVLRNSGGSATAQVTLTIVAAPSAAADAYTTPQNTALNRSAPGVLENDVLNGGAIVSYGASSGTEQATVGTNTNTSQSGNVRLGADGSLTYTPPSGFSGSDTFKYVVANAGGSATATVTITIQGQAAPDFIVTSPGFFFSFSGVDGENPVITLQRGRTYRFQINTSFLHPFEILNAPAGSVTNNNISSGILTFTVPNSAPNLRYNCSIHDFGNAIATVP